MSLFPCHTIVSMLIISACLLAWFQPSPEYIKLSVQSMKILLLLLLLQYLAWKTLLPCLQKEEDKQAALCTSLCPRFTTTMTTSLTLLNPAAAAAKPCCCYSTWPGRRCCSRACRRRRTSRRRRMQQPGQPRRRSGGGWASAHRCSLPLRTRGGWSRCTTTTRCLDRHNSGSAGVPVVLLAYGCSTGGWRLEHMYDDDPTSAQPRAHVCKCMVCQVCCSNDRPPPAWVCRRMSNAAMGVFGSCNRGYAAGSHVCYGVCSAPALPVMQCKVCGCWRASLATNAWLLQECVWRISGTLCAVL